MTAHPNTTRNTTSEFNHIVATSKKNELIDSLKPLREVAASLSRTVEEIQTTKHELETQRDSVANIIKMSFEELLRIIERHKQQMLKEAKRKVRKEN